MLLETIPQKPRVHGEMHVLSKTEGFGDCLGWGGEREEDVFFYRKKMNRIEMGKRRGGEGREEKGEVGKRRERRGQK